LDIGIHYPHSKGTVYTGNIDSVYLRRRGKINHAANPGSVFANGYMINPAAADLAWTRTIDWFRKYLA
jgi:dienelactone hydrolase